MLWISICARLSWAVLLAGQARSSSWDQLRLSWTYCCWRVLISFQLTSVGNKCLHSPGSYSGLTLKLFKSVTGTVLVSKEEAHSCSVSGVKAPPLCGWSFRVALLGRGKVHRFLSCITDTLTQIPIRCSFSLLHQTWKHLQVPAQSVWSIKMYHWPMQYYINWDILFKNLISSYKPDDMKVYFFFSAASLLVWSQQWLFGLCTMPHGTQVTGLPT